MMKQSIDSETKSITNLIESMEKRCKKKTELLELCQTPRDILQLYAGFIHKLKIVPPKRRKKIKKNMQIYKNKYKFIEKEVQQILELDQYEQELFKLEQEFTHTSNYISETITLVLAILIDYNFITRTESGHCLTPKGELGSNIQEVNCMVFGDILNNKRLNHFTPPELACIFSCFANVPIPDEERLPNVFNLKLPMRVKQMIATIEDFYKEISDIELQYNLEYLEKNLQYELCLLVIDWCYASTEADCKQVYQCAKEKGISVGVFVKAILKINSIASEFEKLCELQPNLELLEKLKEIHQYTLKSIVTNQSLYI